MKQVTSKTQVIQVLPNLDLLILLGNHRELQDSPTIGMLQNRAAQVVRVQSLHDNNDCTIFVVIESGLDSVSISVVDMLAFAVRFRIGQLQRVVNDYDVPAATG